MSFRISISPQRKRSNTGVPQSARPIKSLLQTPLISLIEEIKNQMKQLNPSFQALLTQLFKIATDLEKKNGKYLNYLQQQKAKESAQQESSLHQDRQKSKESSPTKREQSVKCIEMTQSSRLDPTPKQKFLIRRSSLEVDPQLSKDQMRKIAQEAIDQNFIFNLLDFRPQNLKSMSYKKFNQILNTNEKDLFQYLQKIDYQEYLTYLYEPIKFSKQLAEQCISYIDYLKKIIKLQFTNQSSQPSETFDNYQKMLLEVFNCDRAYIYLFDQNQNVFWTKDKESTQKSFISLKGIPGYVRKTSQLLNINEVYSDVRFDQEYDYKQLNKTKSLLACPILEKNEQFIGVILVSSNQNQFKKDDELLIQMISQQCTLHFSQLVLQDYNSKTCEAVQQIVKFSLILSQSSDQKQFARLAQQILLQNYELKQVQIFLKDMQDQDSLFTYVDQIRKKVPKNCGIVGCVYKSGQYYISDSCYRDRYFNKLADIETNLPTITIPISHEEHKVMGVIQYIDTRGIDNIVGKNLKNLQLSNIELTQTFATMISFINNKLIVHKQY